jgi:hypothetical protein
MPVINGVYTKDFPALGRAPIDTDIIPIAEVANQITYKTTIGAIFNAKVFGTTGRLSKFTTANTLGNSILNEIGNAIHLTNAGSSFASFGIINPGTPGDPGVDNDGYIGSTINNDFTIRVNNVEAARFDTAYRFKITTIQNATTDTDKFLVSDGGIVKYRTGTELRSDIGAGVGSVTSVALTMPVAFSVANSPITSSGSLDVTAVGTASQYIRGDGQLATLPTGGGGGSAVNYYLNGSIAASVATYKQMSNSAVIGGGTDFNLVGNGLISQFLTDVGNPNRLLIPGGAWNFEMFFSVSSAGGNQKFYIELLKYNGSTFTSIASGSANPEEITGGTTTDLYLTSLAVPETVLLTTDRLAVRVYIVDNSGGRTVTLHTEDNNLCLVTTTFAGGISALNGLTANTQYFAVGTSGTDFNISSLTDTHTFNLPDASLTNRGVITTSAQTITGSKTFDSSLYIKQRNAFVVPPTGYSFIGSTALGFWFANKSATANYQSVQFDLSGLTDATVRTYIMPNTDGTLALVGGVGVGTVTSVAALTLGTSGTDLSSTVANGTTTPVITLNVPNASATARGVISTGTQTIAGAKTFNTNMIVEFGANTASALQVTSTNAGGRGLAVLATSTVEPFVVTQLGTGKLAVFNSSAGEKFTINNDGNLSNGTYTYTLPSATGTLALTSNITSAISGTTNYIPKFTGANTIGNSIIQDDGTNTSIGYTTNPSLYKLDVNGTLRVAGAATFSSSVTAGATINLPNAFFLTGRNNANTSNIGLIGRNTSDRVIIDADGYGTNIGGGGTVLINPTGGNVGIGNLAIAGYKLDVSGTGRFVGNVTLDSDLKYSSNAGFGIVSQNGTRLVTIQNGAFGVTGAATFSSSVSATQFLASNSSYAALITSTGTTGFGLTAVGSAGGGARDILLAGQNGFSNGFTVQYTGTEMKYGFQNGNVGIGTTTPTNFSGYTTLSIDNTSGSFTEYRQGGINTFRVGSNESLGGFLYTQGSTPIRFGTIDMERMRITSGGNVLIGTSTASAAEKVNISFDRTTNQGLCFNNTSGTAPSIASFIQFRYAGSVVGTIESDGTTTTYNVTSDYRLKEDLQEIKGLEKVNAIKVYDYKWKSNNSRMDGVLAHELAEILPYAVSGEKDEIDEKGNDKMQSVDYSKLVPILVKAIQELNEKIIKLENK